MPGPMVHLIVLHRLSAALRDSGGPQNSAYADLLDEDPCSPYSNFGSVGPDFLFFSLREYGSIVGDVANTIFGIYDAFEPLIDFYEETVEPAITDLEDALAAADQAAFGGFFQGIGGIGGSAAALALSAVAKLVSDNVDLFYPFYPKTQKAEGELKEEENWYWFDFLHYRRTGDFASRLWSLAGNDRDLQRYVLGGPAENTTAGLDGDVGPTRCQPGPDTDRRSCSPRSWPRGV